MKKLVAMRAGAALLLAAALGFGVTPVVLWANDAEVAKAPTDVTEIHHAQDRGDDAIGSEQVLPNTDAEDGAVDVPVASEDVSSAQIQLQSDAQAAAEGPAIQALAFDGIELSHESVVLGQTVVVTPLVSGEGADGLLYNYVWNYEGAWDDWSSTVKEAGAQTPDDSWEFTPTRVGRYELYVDVVFPDGTAVTREAELTVRRNWGLDGLSVAVDNEPYAIAAPLGSSLTISCDLSEGSVLSGLTYNFGWRFGDDWSEWDSTMKSGTAISTSSWSFTPTKAGTYHLFADVIDADGSKQTVEKTVIVGLAYAATGIDLSATSVEVGSSVDVSAALPSGLAGLTYNYVWCFNGGWDEWSSTVKETGEYTAESPWTFTPAKRGTYVLYVDVAAQDGTSLTLSTTLNVNNGWDFAGVVLDKTSPQVVHTPLTVTSQVSGERTDVLEYNYVWSRDNWTEWSSTVKETGGRTSETSFTFTPTRSGRYTFYVDVVDTRSGETVTKQAEIQINARWTLKGLNLSYSSPMRPYAQVTMTPVIEGDSSGLQFNYVWEGDNWYVWDSDLKGGSYSTARSKTVTIGNGGTYSFYVDVVDEYGEKQTAQVLNIRARYAADTINRIEASLASQSPYNGAKFEDALLAAGGTLCNNRRGWWCATYLWWGFQQNNALDLWGTSGIQSDPEWLANEFRGMGRFYNGVAGVQRGDILFSYWAPWRGGQWITHASYVTNVTAATVTVLEGNMGYSSVWHTYSLWDSHLRGYARPAY